MDIKIMLCVYVVAFILLLIYLKIDSIIYRNKENKHYAELRQERDKRSNYVLLYSWYDEDAHKRKYTTDKSILNSAKSGEIKSLTILYLDNNDYASKYTGIMTQYYLRINKR